MFKKIMLMVSLVTLIATSCFGASWKDTLIEETSPLAGDLFYIEKFNASANKWLTFQVYAEDFVYSELARGEVDLGEFLGAIIADNLTIKEAFQSVETWIESGAVEDSFAVHVNEIAEINGIVAAKTALVDNDVFLIEDSEDVGGDFFTKAKVTWVALAAAMEALFDDIYVRQDVMPVEMCVALSNEYTDLVTGTALVTFRAPWAFTLTDMRSSLNSAPGSSVNTIDVNMNGTTVLSTKLTIDPGERTSVTAATPHVISVSAITDDAIFTMDIDAIGSSAAGTGAKVCLYGTREVL